MILNRDEIHNNYQQALRLARRLISSKLRLYGREGNVTRNGEDLAQSVCGQPEVVKLIKTTIFSEKIYENILKISVEELAREFYPDAWKRRFISFADISEEFLISQPDETDEQDIPETSLNGFDQLHSRLKSSLSSSAYRFLNHVLLANEDNHLGKIFSIISGDPEAVETRLTLFTRLYPDSIIPDTTKLDIRASLTEQQIIDIYRNVYCGIERRFPSHFLNYDAGYRSAVITRYLILQILETSPEDIIQNTELAFFSKHKIQNIYRYFNYSFNRVFINAWPEKIPHWLYGRAEPSFWLDLENRRVAVRWLVEQKLGVSSDRISHSRITRRDFNRNGLSYLFNTYYNSVSRALSEAYPDKEPWELGNVPAGYWTDQTAAEAVRWLVNRKGWISASLPELFDRGEFSLKTFSEFGLSTLIHRLFRRNLFQALNAAFPNQFYPWQFVQMPQSYWHNSENLQMAGKWLAHHHGPGERGIVTAIRDKKFSFDRLEHIRIARILNKITGGKIEALYALQFQAELTNQTAEIRLLCRIKTMIQDEYQQGMVSRILQFGLFAPLVKMMSIEYLFRLERIRFRIQRRTQSYLTHSF